jgi:hypothetical protein
MIASDLTIVAPRLRSRNHSAIAAADEVGERQEPALPRGVAAPDPHLQVSEVIGAELVAVRQQRRRAVEIDDDLLRQQRCARRAGKAFAQQEVAVAARDGDGHAGIGHAAQRRDDARGDPIADLIVADPRIEEIAEHVQRAGPRAPGRRRSVRTRRRAPHATARDAGRR